MTASLPLMRFPAVFTRSFDEAEALQSSLNVPVKAQLLDRRSPFEWQANRLVLGDIGISVSRYRAGVRGIAPHVDMYSLIIATRHGAQSSQPGDRAVLAPGKSAALVSANLPADLSIDTNYQGIQIGISTSLLTSTWSALVGAPAKPIRFVHELNLRGRAANVHRLVRFFIDEIERNLDPSRTRMVTSRLGEVLVSALLFDLPHDHSELLHRPARPSEPPFIRRLEEYMEANATHAIALVDLARIAGLSGRAIQAGFRKYRGYSPMGFLRERRFALAQRILRTTSSTVAQVALACGFEHLGRFSVEYRQRFGESPRQTRARRR